MRTESVAPCHGPDFFGKIVRIAGLIDRTRMIDWENALMATKAEAETVIASEIDSLIDKIAKEIAEGKRPGAMLGLVGVRSRGVPIAKRIAERLRQSFGLDAPVGAVDITLYRDDLDRKALAGFERDGNPVRRRSGRHRFNR